MWAIALPIQITQKVNKHETNNHTKVPLALAKRFKWDIICKIIDNGYVDACTMHMI